MHIWVRTFVQCGNLYCINLDVMLKVPAYTNGSYLIIDGGTTNRNADVVTLYSLCGLRSALHGNIIFKSNGGCVCLLSFQPVEMRSHFICLFIWVFEHVCFLSLPSIKCAVAIEASFGMPSARSTHCQYFL